MLNDVDVDVYVHHVVNVTHCHCMPLDRWTYKSSETITSFWCLFFCDSVKSESLSCSLFLLSCSNNIKVIKLSICSHLKYFSPFHESFEQSLIRMLILVSLGRICRDTLFLVQCVRWLNVIMWWCTHINCHFSFIDWALTCYDAIHIYKSMWVRFMAIH